MTVARTGVGSLAFLGLFAWVAVALAHALPGGVLSFSRSGDQLHLSISVPLEDLILAEPSLEALDSAAIGEDLAEQLVSSLARYLTEHLSLEKAGANLPLTLVRALVQPVENDHVGRFKLLVVQMSGALPASKAMFPLTLRYDAVMHEIRSHRASVYWSAPDVEPIKLAVFGFRTGDGKPRAVILTLER